MIWLNGWIWIAAALILAALELLAPGWVFIGLAAAVGLMGVLMLSDIWSAGLPVTLMVTGIGASIVWLILRRVAGRRRHRGE
ncbi:hypothetical protein JHW45_14480 [Paracoccus stylophorae]|uniref:NfeD family protein n=1 Tax=Paracoccus stylophorae TaxID=659350 RepID=A0ABY7ST90_9RHOB|nr:hypothetical protein [Paracoccus stylophorae]WCR10260.1 hypothetical protein JHW45_14480 [Paracoccus stylophorae]